LTCSPTFFLAEEILGYLAHNPTIQALTLTSLFRLHKVGSLSAIRAVLKILESCVGDVLQGFHSEEGLVSTVSFISTVLGIRCLGRWLPDKHVIEGKQASEIIIIDDFSARVCEKVGGLFLVDIKANCSEMTRLQGALIIIPSLGGEGGNTVGMMEGALT